MGALKIDLRMGDTLSIGDAKVRLVKKSGGRCSLVIDAPREVKIQCNKRPADYQEDAEHKQNEACLS